MTKLLHIPENHTQRFNLHNEIHARPPVPLNLPVSASHFALMLNDTEKSAEHQHLLNLCQRFGVNPPPQDAIHFNARFDNFLFHWEQHGEFSTYSFYSQKVDTQKPFTQSALSYAPRDWLAALQGKSIVAAHAVIIPEPNMPLTITEITAFFEGNAIVGSKMTGEDALAFTDFRLHNDGFSRFIIIDKSLQTQQAARLLQRLFEIEVYRVIALLAFPIAQKLAPEVSKAEQRLSILTSQMSQKSCDDAELLEQLTQLAAEVESHISHSQFRFGAAEAYNKIVKQRIIDIREVKIPGIQTLDEFLCKRMQPAMNSCHSTAKRFSLLSKRISNAGQLLRTRVDISIEQQNQALLTSMDLRVKMQLRLQETVEGLSIVAITSYVVNLLHSFTKALQSAGYITLKPEIISGIAIPVVLVIVAIGVRRLHKVIKRIDE